jgi:tetratricopeptide (TPR) repeat protein
VGVLKSQCFMGIGNFRSSLEAAEAAVNEGMKLQGNKVTVIDALLVKANALLGLFQVDKAFKVFEQAEQVEQELPTDDQAGLDAVKANILNSKAIGFYYRDDVHKGIECARKSLSIRERLGDLPGIVDSLMRVGYLHIEVDGTQTHEYVDRALELNKEVGNKGLINAACQYKALVEQGKGNWDEAERLLEHGINLARKHDFPASELGHLLALAFMYQGKGDYQRAEEHYRQCLATSEKRGMMLFVAMCSNNLGEIYRAQGRLDDALAGYERAMKINKEMDRLKGYAGGLGNCGMIQYARGNLDEALSLLEEALTIAKERKEAGLLMRYIGGGILNLVQVLVEKGMIEEAQQHLEDFPQIADDEGRLRLNQVYRTTAAIVLKSSNLARERALAKQHLIEVVDGKLVEFEITSMAYLLLCDLLVEDLRISGEEIVLEELKERLSSFADATTEQGSTMLQAEALILQSRIALLELDTEESDRLLTQAQVLASQKGLDRLAEKAVADHEMLLSELSLSDELEHEKPTMSERTSKARINEQIGQMIKQGVWRKMLF